MISILILINLKYQNTYVEAGVRYYVFVEKGTKLDELTNDPNASSEELIHKDIKQLIKIINGENQVVTVISTQKEILLKDGQ